MLGLSVWVGDADAHSARLRQRQMLGLAVNGGTAGEDELLDAELFAALKMGGGEKTILDSVFGD